MRLFSEMCLISKPMHLEFHAPKCERPMTAGDIVYSTELFMRVVTPERAALFSAFPFLLKLPSCVPGGLGLKDAPLSKQYAKDMLDIPYDYVIRNRENEAARACMVSDALVIYQILQGTDNPEMVTEIKAAAASVYGASVESTIGSLVIFTPVMMNDPEVQERAQSEIDNVVGFDRLPNFDDLPALTYVEALIREFLGYLALIVGVGNSIHSWVMFEPFQSLHLEVLAGTLEMRRFGVQLHVCWQCSRSRNL
ncbi:hypothetical protein AZE42_11003 [Rhizopogon vesiculosus]|uniref:Cytochrome P450 n=1 Tax=Rhizopogon vesiculosus TaxID=180088 RepID=A0A1J8PPV0_9AGAM|nr:hypothetical protein AZE42_11003 [Rhizopogon vesiculosus]